MTVLLSQTSSQTAEKEWSSDWMLISLAVKEVENYGISQRTSDLEGSLAQYRFKVTGVCQLGYESLGSLLCTFQATSRE